MMFNLREICQYIFVYSATLQPCIHTFLLLYCTHILSSLSCFFGYFQFTLIQLVFLMPVIKPLLCCVTNIFCILFYRRFSKYVFLYLTADIPQQRNTFTMHPYISPLLLYPHFVVFLCFVGYFKFTLLQLAFLTRVINPLFYVTNRFLYFILPPFF